MTTAEMIKLLETYPKDTEITIWNGLVGDCVPVGNIDTLVLRKRDADAILMDILMDKSRKDKVFYALSDATAEQIKRAKKLSKEEEWDLPNQFMDDDALGRHYPLKKEVLVLEPIVQGKTYSDRLGSIAY